MSSTIIPTAYITEEASDLISAMAKTGLWGDSAGDVVTHLIYAGVQKAVGQGLIPIAAPEIEDPEAKPHGPNCPCTADELVDCGEPGCFGAEPRETFVGGVRRTRFKCENCHDGARSPEDETSDFTCPRCGTCTMPF